MGTPIFSARSIILHIFSANASDKDPPKIVKSCVINAGDGSREHPTQALLDALTIKKKFGSFKNLRIAICGDIMHSRVARSNIEILNKLGSNINIIGPKEWIPADIKKLKIGYAPYAFFPAKISDKRRFGYYAKQKKIAFEIADHNKKYD